MKTRQKSENGKVPKSARKREERSTVGGTIGKAVPVKQQSKQLDLFIGTAERWEAEAEVTPGGIAEHNDRRTMDEFIGQVSRPKPMEKEQESTTAMIDRVCERLAEALEKVARNKGAPGPNRQTIDEVRKHWNTIVPVLTDDLQKGKYMPGDIRRVWIPKSDGSQRGLGIPDVIDRVVQEAVRQVLEPMYEPGFHDGSHGFRAGRSCHTAIAAAQRHMRDGYLWVVDIDLEKFFDTVNHQRLMARLAERTKDRSLLVLIGRMLKARVVMPDGVVVNTEEGVPQGGPLSPLLSNIVLTELDEELSRRGHRFVRYADDANIYVKSERAGTRVMASVKSFIERRLRLKVNANKSAVARPEERHFLGFRLRPRAEGGDPEVLLSVRSQKRIDEKVRELTPRTWGQSMDDCFRMMNVYLTGWLGFFGICTEGVKYALQGLDAHIRRRLRAIQLRHWKTKRTILRKLKALGRPANQAYKSVYGGQKSAWALSNSYALTHTLNKRYFANRGLFSLVEAWEKKHLPPCPPSLQNQLALALE